MFSAVVFLSPIFRHRLSTRWTLWVALWMAFAPTLSYLWGARAGMEMVELCSSFGVQQVWVDAQAPDANGEVPEDLAASGHCPFCLNLPQLGVLPVADFHFSARATAIAPVAFWRAEAAPATSTWRAQAPRAPPTPHA